MRKLILVSITFSVLLSSCNASHNDSKGLFIHWTWIVALAGYLIWYFFIKKDD